MISYGYAPVLGPSMTITMPVGGPCSMHGHEGPGACVACVAEIERFNEAMRKAQPAPQPFPVFPQPMPAIVWPLIVGGPHYEGLQVTHAPYPPHLIAGRDV